MAFVPILVLAASLIILVLSSETLVSSAIRIAHITGFNEFAIGIVFIAIGTSLPEFAVSMLSAFANTQTLSIGTLFGSSIADMTIVFGIICFAGFVLSKKDVEVIETLLLSSMIVVFALILGRIDVMFGLFSILLFGLFLHVIVKRHYKIDNGKKPWIVTPELVKHAAIMIISIAAIIMSAHFTVSSAMDIADIFGLSSMIIGALVIGVGSVLPELTVSIIAVRKGNIPLAIGNVIGSVVVNVVLILGIVSLFNPIVVDSITAMTMYSFLAISGVLIGFALHKRFNMLEGICLMSAYAGFVVVLLSYGVFL
ncbi:MAG: sodium:calcium antiporter [Candidatus Aenigmarchaeota archaeon]|nr:sodium:calcium antiporter [Candidatus Aenigmarchaeota archaeon]